MRLTLPIVLLALALTHSQQPLAFAAADDPDVEKEAAPVEPEDPACPSRPHIIRCAAAHLDVNKNNKLERQELQDAIDSLPWLARGVLKIIGSVDKIMSKCDADGDGAISIDHDMAATEETCLRRSSARLREEHHRPTQSPPSPTIGATGPKAFSYIKPTHLEGSICMRGHCMSSAGPNLPF